MFSLVQGIGFICLLGGESFAITEVGYRARVLAMILLEPGLIVMQMVVDKLLLHSKLTIGEAYWLGTWLGVVFNTLCFAICMRPIADRSRRVD